MSDVERIIVLRQVAALRRRGETAATALERAQGSLRAGVVRDEVTSAARALASGGAVVSGDFARVLSMPTAEAGNADALAEALEARLEARDAMALGRGLAQLAVVTPLVTLALVGWLDFGPLFNGATLPPATAALRELSGALKWVGVPLAGVAAWLVGKLRWDFSPGARRFSLAQRVLAASTFAEPGATLAGLGLSALEVAVVLAGGAPSSGLRALAAEMRREARASVEVFRLVAPVVFALVVGGFFSGVLIALYLPIFSIAGSIK